MSHSFIYSSADGHLGCFHIMAIISSAAMNIGVLMFFQISGLGSFAYISRSGITGSKGTSTFNFWSYLHTAFHGGCPRLHSHPQCKRVPLPSHPCLLLLFVDLLIPPPARQCGVSYPVSEQLGESACVMPTLGKEETDLVLKAMGLKHVEP